MAKRKLTNNSSTILSSFVILLLVIMVVGFLFIYTDNFSTPLKTFYVSCGNDDIISDRENFNIVVGQEYKFDITTNINLSGTDSKYHVSVVPNNSQSANFTFTAASETIEYSSLKSLSKGFVISPYEEYFTIKANLDLPEILSLYYNESIAGVPTAINSKIAYFRLVVQSGDLTETININFSLISE